MVMVVERRRVGAVLTTEMFAGDAGEKRDDDEDAGTGVSCGSETLGCVDHGASRNVSGGVWGSVGISAEQGEVRGECGAAGYGMSVSCRGAKSYGS